ncbi:MAG: DNA repair protein RadA [Pseudomonadota bacterium]|nr:DNA repair protein RadA [Pseudomonadota bacterium]
MAKPKTLFVCNACGAQSPKWVGQCADCGAWNTLEETQATTAVTHRSGYAGEASALRRLTELESAEELRTSTGLREVDRVLGGGIVRGGVTLIGGDPGIGKSTLLLQLVARVHDALPTLYVAGEESLQQIHLRAQRLGVADVPITALAETCVERIMAQAEQARPGLLVIDSIQTIFTETLQSAAGSVSQLRESTAQLVRYAKRTGTAVLLIGHVTKEGAIAGPRVLEHMVDTVLYFESDVGGRYRVVRAVKNRFGAANELGVFAMTDGGLKEVSHPSAIFLSRHEAPMTGSVITCIREGTRPMLLEVQALVDESPLQNPRRVTVGMDQNRLAMLLAILHRHGGVAMFNQDVFVNVVGGMRIGETASDLSVLLAVLSSFRNQPLGADTLVFGELGLAGEVRPVPNGEERLNEAAKHGFRRAIVPYANQPRHRTIEGLEVIGLRRMSEALDLL